MGLLDLFQRLGIALGLGLIVGLQRERSGSTLGGFRTFPLVTLFGAVCALLAETYTGWVIAAGLAALAAVIVVGHVENISERGGITTEVAMLLMFVVGAFAAVDRLQIAATLGGTVAVLLHLKPQMHQLAKKLGDPDFKAIMQFVLITLVILPIVPNEEYGPYKVLNPYKIWLMVVLIVGISLGGYIVYKFFGQRAGTLAGGVLGGLISSTATTVSYARRTKNSPEAARSAALVIMMASAIVFGRVLILVGAVAPALLPAMAGPLGTVFVALLAISIGYWLISKKENAEMPEQGNPSELKAALVFAGLYALILLAVAATKERFGSSGLYVVSVISGLTDMDAITLSIGEMAKRNEVGVTTAWKLVLVAALSNLVFKTGVVAFLGGRALLKRVSVLFALSFAVGVAVILWWPGGDTREPSGRSPAATPETVQR
jgi:uncharacterized membrane protein (DUF4010 family)